MLVLHIETPVALCGHCSINKERYEPRIIAAGSGNDTSEIAQFLGLKKLISEKQLKVQP